MDPGTGSQQQLTSGQDTWSARCGESRTAGAGGGSRETTGSDVGTAPAGLPHPAWGGKGGSSWSGSPSQGSAVTYRGLPVPLRASLCARGGSTRQVKGEVAAAMLGGAGGGSGD